MTAGDEGGGEGETEGKTGGTTTPPSVNSSTEGDAKSEEKEKYVFSVQLGGFQFSCLTPRKVRNFQLDPNAKSFSFNLGAKEFVPSSAALLSLEDTSPLVQSASVTPFQPLSTLLSHTYIHTHKRTHIRTVSVCPRLLLLPAPHPHASSGGKEVPKQARRDCG